MATDNTQPDIQASVEEALIADASEVVFRGVMLKVMASLPEEKQEILGNLFEASGNDPENDDKHKAIYDFLNAEVPNIDQMVEDELMALTDEQETVLAELDQLEKERQGANS